MSVRTRPRRAPPTRAVVLLSGGMDSATCLAEAVARGRRVHALSVEYGQRHRRELASARALARWYRVERHTVVNLPIGSLLRSSLTDSRRAVPLARPGRKRIPSTYVPARNTLLLALALSAAESSGAQEIYLGVNAVDYSGYPDCRPEFLRAFARLASVATRDAVERGRLVRVRAPLLRLSKVEIVRRGETLGVPWELTWSCYQGGARPCGSCDSCVLRAKGFAGAGREDPALSTSMRPERTR